jgi:hypothetical protein
MKWMPENTDENVAAGRALSSRCGRTIAVKPAPARASAAAVAYGACAPKAYSRPPTDGPMIVAVWKAPEDHATALGTSAAGTSVGVSAWDAGP